MTVTADDVRSYLNNISDERVDDDVITKQIEVATTLITNSIAAGVRDADKNNAILAYAGFLSYQAYCTEYERTVGQVPPFMVGHLNQLAGMANTLLSLTRKGSPVYTCPVAQPDSMDAGVYTGTVGI